jgi:nucleotide-binding universal stress UspA family protein
VFKVDTQIHEIPYLKTLVSPICCAATLIIPGSPCSRGVNMSQVLVPKHTEPSGSTPYKKILVAVDGSENSKKAARVAIWLSSLSRATLVVLAVVQLPLLLDQGIPAGSSIGIGDYLTQMKKYFEKVVAEVAQEAMQAGIQVEQVVLDGATSVVQSITEYAEKNDVGLIVVGTRGLGGFKKLVLGSVSSGLVNHASCSVLVVR